MNEQAKCSLCGEPMPAGEEMFKFHGYSGACPKPPLVPRPDEIVRESAQAVIAKLTAERDELLAILKDCVTYEERVAGYSGLLGCTCIGTSRDSEREYETGRCPHQVARAAITKAEGQ